MPPWGTPSHGVALREGHRVRTATMAPERNGLKEVVSNLSKTWQASASPSPLPAPSDEFRHLPVASQASRDVQTIDNPDEYHPSRGWKTQPHHPSKQGLWQQLRLEAWRDAAAEPSLASFLYSTILSHTSLENTLAFLLSNKLSNSSTLLESVQLMGLFQRAYASDPEIIDGAVADMLAVKDRDPACDKYSQALLHFKGYQAMQCHRVSHWLWNQGRQTLALALQSRASELFHVDIHPGASIGRGVLLDHATGVVIGETAVVGDNVSMLHQVSLGGSGTGKGTRHPSIGHGVLLGAGVSVLGPVYVGPGSKVGAGSVVISDLPAHSVAVGVPARVIKRDVLKEPVKDMDQCEDFILDYVI